MNKRIKIGQIGIGHNHAQGNMEALRKLPEYFEIVGVVESDPEWLKKRGKLDCYKGLRWISEEGLLNNPELDAVAIETDVPDLIPTALRCAKHDLHIHLDKPGCESMTEFSQFINCCKERKLVIQMAYAYRYNPAIRFAINAVKSDWLGEIFEIHAVMSRYDGDNPDYRQWMSQFKGGAMYIFAGYLIDIIITMLGPPEKVTDFLKKTRNDTLIDNGLAVLEYKRATATVRVSVEEVDGMKHRRLIICGTKGSIEICPLEHSCYYTSPLLLRLTLKNDILNYKAGTHTINCGVMGDRYTPQLIEFAEIIKGKKNPFDYSHELLVQETLLIASGYETGKSIKI